MNGDYSLQVVGNGKCVSFAISPKALKVMLGPGVYAILGESGYLYIGSAKNMLHRISNPTHDSARKAIIIATTIEFYPTSTEAVARAWESGMINTHCPQYNILGNPSKLKNNTNPPSVG